MRPALIGSSHSTSTRDACEPKPGLSLSDLLRAGRPARVVPADHAGDPICHARRRGRERRPRQKPSWRRELSAPASSDWDCCAATGGRLKLTPELEPELFRATIGGLGLTGVIEWVEFQLVPIRSAFLDVEIVPYGSLDEFWSVAEESVGRFEHTVAWIDCLTTGASTGRGVFTRANWSEDGQLNAHDDRTFKSLPFDFPGFALNGLSVAAFNELYYRVHRRKQGKARQHYSAFFYPLDAIHNWNRLYGSRGMLAISMRDSVGERTGGHARSSR